MTINHVNEDVQDDDVNLEHLLSADYQPEFGDEDDLDDPLAVLTEEEKRAYEAIQQKIMTQDPILEFYKQLEDKPSDEQIESWKEQVGEVYFAQISETEHFVFRAIKRKEWRDLLKRLEAVKDPLKQDEAIVMKGVMHPALNNLKVNMLSAGTINTMKELIMQASNFFPPEYALQLVRKL